MSEELDPTPTPEPVAPPIVATPVPVPKRTHRGHRRRLRRGPYRPRAAAASHTAALPAGDGLSAAPAGAPSAAAGNAARHAFLVAQDEFLDTVGDDSDEAARIRLQFKRLSRKATHLQTCGPDCVQVEIDVPAASSNANDHFRIGSKEYRPGKYTVYACVARELAYLIDKNRRVDDRRMREATHTLSAGAIRADRIRAEN